MKQILHIFTKDARHFLPEILVSLAITAAFAWIYPHQWTQRQFVGAVAGGLFFEPGLLASLLTLLVPVSWWLLISRVVHAETLVGDCQFWITRPYEWKKLFAAKALFLFCFLYLPLLLAQCSLLMQAGFPPVSYLSGLVFNLFLITAVLVLPLFALATVTSSFARMTLVLLGILLCFIAALALSTALNSMSISDPMPDHLTLPLLFCGLLVIVVFQYRTRRTWLARILLIALVVVIWAGTSLTPNDARIHRAYPRTNNTQPPSLQLPPQSSMDQPTASLANNPKWIVITLPMQISGIADGYAWSAENVKVSIEGPQGLLWSSPWQATNANRSLPGQPDFIVHFELERAIFEQLKSTPVTVHLTFAWTQLRSGPVRRINIPTHDFVVPDFGVCSPDINWAAPHTQIERITCRHALRQPRLTYLDTRWSEDPCSGPATAAGGGIEGSGWTGGLDPDPAELSIAAVSIAPLPLSNNWNEGRQGSGMKPRHICPGTPLTFTGYSVAQRTQSDFTIANFRFPAYKASPEAGAGGIGIEF
jgi:ABC-type transport system involved in multi-copper enzyme maturation permease subunit